MIIDILIKILSSFFSLIHYILPNWQIWPDVVLNSLRVFASSLARFDFIFPIKSLFDAIIFYIGFEISYYTVKLIVSTVGFFRGSDNIKI